MDVPVRRWTVFPFICDGGRLPKALRDIQALLFPGAADVLEDIRRRQACLCACYAILMSRAYSL